MSHSSTHSLRAAAFGALLLIASAASAETAQSETAKPRHRNFCVSFPVYFFDDYAVNGIQAAYQFEKWQLRSEVDFANVFDGGTFPAYILPSAGVMYAEAASDGMRLTQGVDVAGELDSTDGFALRTVRVNFLFGAEFLAFKNKAFYAEFGPCMNVAIAKGKALTGAVIGCGVRMYF